MKEEETKPLIQSMTFIALLALLIFNLIDDTRFDFIYGYMDEFVNTGLTILAAYGRLRASKQIEGVV